MKPQLINPISFDTEAAFNGLRDEFDAWKWDMEGRMKVLEADKRSIELLKEALTLALNYVRILNDKIRKLENDRSA